MTQDLSIRFATPSDAAALAFAGERMFRDAFGPMNDPADVDEYCSKTYGLEAQRRELTDPGWTTLLVERGGELSGYAQLHRSTPPPCVAGPEPLELRRFYVDRRWHGTGAADRLMAVVLGTALRRGAQTLFLAVFESNTRAIAFYARHGFRDVGWIPFALGKDVQTDRIMVRALA